MKYTLVILTQIILGVIGAVAFSLAIPAIIFWYLLFICSVVILNPIGFIFGIDNFHWINLNLWFERTGQKVADKIMSIF